MCSVMGDEHERTSAFASSRRHVEEISQPALKIYFGLIAHAAVRAQTAADREKRYCVRGFCAVRRSLARRRASNRRGSGIANQCRKTAWRIDDAPHRIVH